MSSILTTFFLIYLLKSIAASNLCPKPCICPNNPQDPSYSSLLCSLASNESGCTQEVLSLKFLKSFDQISELEIRCAKISSGEYLNFLKNLTKLSIASSNLTNFPWKLLVKNQNLKTLNLTSNQLLSIDGLNAFQSIEILDLSNNSLKIFFPNLHQFSRVRVLLIQNNRLQSTTGISHLLQLQSLDVSSNPFDKGFNLTSLLQLSSLTAKNVRILSSLNAAEACKSCSYFPPNAVKLDLQENDFISVPTCEGLFTGVNHISSLNLSRNLISILTETTFNGKCFRSLKTLDISRNRLMEIFPKTFQQATSLKYLNISRNLLQHVSPILLQQFATTRGSRAIEMTHNRWSCDCLQRELYTWLKSNSNFHAVFVCSQPHSEVGNYLETLPTDKLKCTNASIESPNNVTVPEFNDAKLVCKSSGIPDPIVYWLTPHNETISLSNLANDKDLRKTYQLSEFGKTLTVKEVHLSKTGIYRCIASNKVSSADHQVSLSVILSQTSTIIILAVSCTTFMIAVVVNLINIFVYICEQVEAKRIYKKALQAQNEEAKVNPPIKHRSKSLDESMASLNANRHYDRYDYTCQQVFLDTVVKGAHSVKKTLYDARHSEFSANMWEYAANLRDRLHIEMPSGMQLPNISMPSISMPSISMPTITMPKMQDINTNIEKLGSSVVQRSHTLASSVGSVFTLRKWMGQFQGGAGENESQDSDDDLEVGHMTQVKVDVHANRYLSHIATSRDDCDVIRDDEIAGCSGTSSSNKQQPHIDDVTSNYVVSNNPGLNTISSIVDSQWHSYETSV